MHGVIHTPEPLLDQAKARVQQRPHASMAPSLTVPASFTPIPSPESPTPTNHMHLNLFLSLCF